MVNALVAIEGVEKRINEGYLKELGVSLLRVSGLTPHFFEFPNYKGRTGKDLKRFLEGVYGNPFQASAKHSTGFYARHRAASLKEISHSLDFKGEDSVTIIDGYDGRNLAHQLPKLPESDWEEFVVWADNLEHEKFKLPRADLTICLINPQVKEVSEFRKKVYATLPEHYLEAVDQAYGWLINNMPHWHAIDCNKKTIEMIAKEMHSLILNH